jgi:HSP20 family protein
MKKSDLAKIFNGGQLAYPGTYIPLSFNWHETMKDIRANRAASFRPLSNLFEFADHYQIDLAAPGHHKEDFIVHLKNRKLEIVACRTQKKSIEKSVYLTHEFNFDSFDHSVALPPDVDADRISAVYKDGILSFYLPKTSQPDKEAIHKIIVY